MPDEKKPENTEQNPLKGTKYEGKSAEELAKMHEDLEALLGRQGEELGALRSSVQEMQQREAAGKAKERDAANKSDYETIADDLFLNPKETLPRIVDDVRRKVREEVMAEVEGRMSNQTAVTNFFRANPELNRYQEVVGAFAERIFQTNPALSIDQVLVRAKEASLKWIASMRERLKEDDTAARKKAAITTSGGKARESEETPSAEGEGRKEELSTEQKAVMDEIKAIKDFRTKRIVPPRVAR